MAPDKPERLFIKVILPKQGAERRVKGGAAPPRPFRTVDAAFRGRLSNQIHAISKAITPSIRAVGAAPVRLKLLPKAAAKSHRPETLFTDRTCPIIGGGSLGELFVRATTSGLSEIDSAVKSGTSEQTIKELSTIETIEPITPEFRTSGIDPADILRRSPRRDDSFVTRVQLFDFGPGRGQEKLVSNFEETCRSNKIHYSRAGYSEDSYKFEVRCKTQQDVQTVSKIVGVKSIRHMPAIRGFKTNSIDFRPLPEKVAVPPLQGEFPVVVVVDSGVTEQNEALEKWIVGRTSTVAPPYRNVEHGTFVAGLITWGRELNPDIQSIDSNPCGVFDLQVIPNWDPARGDTDVLYESDLLQALETALQQHAGKYEVWNLSLGLDDVCSLSDFSPLAVELDNLQERYKVSFVISAGNYTLLPMLDYPRTSDQLGPGRITSPADSVLGVTVGSISHYNHASRGPKIGEPSTFSRHGAGPNYVIKPDVVHYGGTCRSDATECKGIRSLSDLGSSCESVGTSYATPLVSRTLANIYHQIVPSPSPVLARAILTHHARDSRTGGRVADTEENALGFGLPAPTPYCLECPRHSSTLVFEDSLRPGYYLEWDDFPYPDSLRRAGRYFGDIWMTVAFTPARGARWGTEYCETHIDAHLGVYYRQRSRDTGKEITKFKGLVPPEHKNPGILFESYQVEHLRKWAPVRTYFGSLGERGTRGDRWRLMVRLLSRHGIEDSTTFTSQPFALIVTIADPTKKASIYDEMARQIRTRYRVQNLTLRPTIRIQQ